MKPHLKKRLRKEWKHGSGLEVSFIYLQLGSELMGVVHHFFELSVESGVEDEVAALAFPTHGLIVGVVITSGVGNSTNDCWRVCVGSLDLGVCRHLNGFTVSAWVAPSLAFWWPWTDLSSHNCLLFTYWLSKSTKVQMAFINYNSMS